MCYLFGDIAKEPITEITPTLLTPHVLTTLRQCDFLAYKVSLTILANFVTEGLKNLLLILIVFEYNKVLKDSGYIKKISQMPVVLIPIHFERGPLHRHPSCQRSGTTKVTLSYDQLLKKLFDQFQHEVPIFFFYLQWC